jgi:hypothetical protein
MRAFDSSLSMIAASAVAVAAACGGSTEGSYCMIQASNYDQSCTTASDCTAVAGAFPVQFGDYCTAKSTCLCGDDAINKGSVTEYAANVSKTPLGMNPGQCACPDEGTVCCLANKCGAGPSCNIRPQQDGGADALDSALPEGSVYCSAEAGPADAADGEGRWCVSMQTCESLNGVWECCIDLGGQQTICSAPAEQ